MISQRELERRYNRLMYEVKNNDFYKIDLQNRLNVYSCSCGHDTITIDIDAGVTPFMYRCEKCGNRAISKGYQVQGNLTPTLEWYNPMDNEEGYPNHYGQGLQNEWVDLDVLPNITVGYRVW